MSRPLNLRENVERGGEVLRTVGDELTKSPEVVSMGLATGTTLDECQARIWSPDPEAMVSFSGATPSSGAEEFRSLRSRLYRFREKQQLKSLLVTSAVPREGRSFVAANLANVLALQPNCRVLLIDADLRSPRLHSILGTTSSPGLTDYLLEGENEFSAMQKGTLGEMYFLPSGRLVPGPTELLGTENLITLFDRCEPLFDWIIVDSPSTLSFSDAGLIANCCDGVLLVVRSNSTPFDLAAKARQRFRQESLVGVVLNDIKSMTPAD